MQKTLKIAAVSDDPNRPTPDNVKVPETKVDLLYPTPGANLHVYWHQGLSRAYEFDRQGWNVMGSEHAKFSGANIAKARNELVQMFLEGTSEWALFLDTDMVIETDTIARLLCSAAVSGADVISGLCVMVGSSGPIPTIYQFGNFAEGEVTRVAYDYPDNQIVQVAATGTACLLVKREVFESIAASQPENPYPWFREEVINTQWISEDIFFCFQANAHDHPVFVDCTTHVGHAKGSKVWMPDDVRKESSMPEQQNVVVIPVKNQLEMTSDLVNQLRKQDETDQIVIIDNGSGKKMRNWLSSQKDLTVLDMPGAGIHEMWNAGAEIASSSGQKRNVNVTFLNNDIRIGDNFISNMQTALRSSKGLMAVSANYDGRIVDGLYQTTDEICGARYDGTGGFAGFAFMVRGEWFESGYKFPEECKWWFGDNDIINMVKYTGGQVGIAGAAKCEHLDGGSKTAGDPMWTEYTEQTNLDRLAFEERWAKIMEQDALYNESQESVNA